MKNRILLLSVGLLVVVAEHHLVDVADAPFGRQFRHFAALQVDQVGVGALGPAGAVGLAVHTVRVGQDDIAVQLVVGAGAAVAAAVHGVTAAMGPDAPLGPGSLQRFVEADFAEHYFSLLEEPAHGPALRRIAGRLPRGRSATVPLGTSFPRRAAAAHAWAVGGDPLLLTPKPLGAIVRRQLDPPEQTAPANRRDAGKVGEGREAGGEGEQRFAGAGRAEQGDEIDFRIHEQVQGQTLFLVACDYAPDGVMLAPVVPGELRGNAVVADVAHPEFHVFLGIGEELVGPDGDFRPGYAVPGAAGIVPGFYACIALAEETLRQRVDTAEQQVRVIQDLVVVVVLGLEADDCRLDAQVDVFGYQRYTARIAFGQRQRRGEDGVVGRILGNEVVAARFEWLGLQEQPAEGAVAVADGRQLEEVPTILAPPHH